MAVCFGKSCGIIDRSHRIGVSIDLIKAPGNRAGILRSEAIYDILLSGFDSMVFAGKL